MLPTMRVCRPCVRSRMVIGRRGLSSLREGLEKLSFESLSPKDKKDILRRAHATESFRAMFAKAADGHSVSTLDLEELMMQNRVRPSALLGVYSLGACALGIVNRGMKVAGAADCMENVVDDAVQQQFNDSIRDMQTMEADEETKEALKFHRDVMASGGGGYETPQEDAAPMGVMSGPMKTLQESGGVMLYYLLRTSSKV